MTDKEALELSLDMLERDNLKVGNIYVNYDIQKALIKLIKKTLDGERKKKEWQGLTEEELIRRVMERLPTMPVKEREEPVAWRNKNGKDRWQYRSLPILIEGEPLYTAPPPREWQGLTDEEAEEVERWVEFKEEGSGRIPTGKLIRYIEAKLKEKNT